MIYESGTYGVGSAPGGSGVWLGLVQNYDLQEKQNVIQTRFLGQTTRNVGLFQPGPLDFSGKIQYLAQDWRMLGFALGSITTTSGTSQVSNYQFNLSEVNTGVRANAFTSGTFNPWISFSLEESRTGPTANQNFMRTLKGCVVEQFQLNISEKKEITIDLDIIGQSGSWFSGTTTVVTAGSNRSYLWSDAVLQIAPDLAGTAAVTNESVKSFTFSLKNGFVGPHYVNGSRVIATPYPLNRDYLVTAVQDLDSSTAGSLYNALFQGGSIFNAVLDVNDLADTGSHHLILTFSGCKMIDMKVPAKISSVNEATFVFVPGSVSAIAHDRLPTYTLY